MIVVSLISWEVCVRMYLSAPIVFHVFLVYTVAPVALGEGERISGDPEPVGACVLGWNSRDFRVIIVSCLYQPNSQLKPVKGSV